jgi:K+-transporting ATPase ATPase C chain
MVDLDSDPTKLIDIVEIGKQLLITRGALTTFSIANDVAKYFAIIPAMFVGRFPGWTLNIMRLQSANSAILSAVIFNALIIVGAHPDRPQGRRLSAARRQRAAAPQPARLWSGRAHRAFHRHQTHRPRRCPHPRIGLTMTVVRPALAALKMLLVLTLILGVLYPLGMTAVGRLMTGRADGSLLVANGTPVGSSLLAQNATDAKWFHTRPSVSDAAGDTSGGSNLGPNEPDQAQAVADRVAALRAENPDAQGPIPADALTASSSGLDPHISPAYAEWQAMRVAEAQTG